MRQNLLLLTKLDLTKNVEVSKFWFRPPIGQKFFESKSFFTPAKINVRFSNQIINLFFEKEKSELLIPAGWNNNQVF